MTIRILPAKKQHYGDQLVRSADERYELEKRQWQSEHPEATPAEYSKAMMELARRLGI